MIMRLTCEATNESALIPVLRHIAILPLKALGVVDEDIDRVATIISEGCSNVVKYAYAGREIYTISMQYCAERAIVGISDTGRGYSEEAITAPTPGQIGGYGLSLIRNAADSVHMKSTPGEGTLIVAEVLLHYKDEESRKQAEALGGAANGIS